MLLSALYIYPIKSCRGIAVSAAQLTPYGLQWDRNWLITRPDGQFITQRQIPQLALIETAITADALELRAPGMPVLRLPLEPIAGDPIAVTIWQDRCLAIDQGKEAAEWLSGFLQTPCRLVRMGEGYDRPVEPDYAAQPGQVSFADAYPLLLISEASLADLNDRLSEALPMNRFRPNLVVSGCAAYAEDTWHTIQIETIGFDVVKPCIRCVIPTTDQATAVRGKEPLQTLATYRRIPAGIIFGQNLIHRGLGELRVNSPIQVLHTR